MDRFKLLGIITTGELIWFCFIIVTFQYSHVSSASVYSVSKSLAPLAVIFSLILTNLFVLYTIFIRKSKKLSYPFYQALTVLPVFWFVLSFVGFFFASQVFFPLITLILAIIFYRYLKNVSRNLALFSSLFTMLIMGVVIFSSLEEDFCTRVGIAADPTGRKYIEATREDAKLLSWNNVKKGDKIGVEFRSHFVCHSTFHFSDAVLKSYLHW